MNLLIIFLDFVIVFPFIREFQFSRRLALVSTIVQLIKIKIGMSYCTIAND